MFSTQFETIDCAYPIIKETIPKSSLGYNTNNKYPEFPPLMNDGRSVTASYQPESVINNELITKNGIESNWKYRKYLTENSKQIMEWNFREACNDAGYFKKHNETPLRGMEQHMPNSTPYLFNSVVDNAKPFGYANSDLKEIYLSREQLNARKISPAITQEEIWKKMK
jgi:hypothetical protein